MSVGIEIDSHDNGGLTRDPWWDETVNVRERRKNSATLQLGSAIGKMARALKGGEKLHLSTRYWLVATRRPSGAEQISVNFE